MTTESLPTTLAETAEFLARHETKDMLRFITCGSVDDGKSTLIGRLLIETGAVYDDQLAALKHDSTKHGTTDLDVDPALLLDGLEDERQQGITIDVAYRYFQTPRRKFIIADSPGHEQYTRNMVTAASTAKAAIILMDARKGMLPQTRRHSFIASLVGVRSLILAVNKMDLVDYSEEVFNRLSDEFLAFAKRLDVRDIHRMPLSGLRGDNVIRKSQRMAWYEGPPLLEVLETLPVGDDDLNAPLRYPVQRVVRPTADFRGYAGTVASGTVRVGDQVMVLPGRQQSRVKSIVTFDGDLPSASAGNAVTLTLEDEIDITRGEVLAHPDRLPQVDKHFDATLVWMSQTPLVPGKSYWLKIGPKHVAAEVQRVTCRIDVNTLNRVETANLKLNEVGYGRIEVHAPIAFDPYRQNHHTGNFILVDRVSHETVAAGMIIDPRTDAPPGEHFDVGLPSRQLQFTPSRISAQRRQARFGHPGLTILMSGLSGSGKTTLAFALEEILFDAGHAVTVLDGQNMRHGISRDLGFTIEERSENLRRASEICRLFNDAGLICVAAFVAPDEATRAKARDVVGRDRWLHIHLSAPPEVCRKRDASGRYEAADRGEIASFPGVTVPFAPPTDADLVLHTDQMDAATCLDSIRRLVNAKLNPNP
jgi:bifunctional enzyme CysN/CysC